MTKKRGRFMSNTERDLVGLEARHARAASQVEVEEVADEPSDGVVRNLRSEDITSPVDLYHREHSDDEKATLHELCEVGDVNPESPITLADFVKIVTRVNELKLEERENNRHQSNRLIEAMGKKPPAEMISAFEASIATMRKRVNIMWAVIAFALTAAGGSTVAVAKWLRESGRGELQEQLLIEHDKDHELRIRAVEDLAHSNSSRIDDHIDGSRRRNLTPDPPPAKLGP